jgi:uncharacterized protein (TIGR03118 family)
MPPLNATARVSVAIKDSAIVIAPASPPAGTLNSSYAGFGFSASGGSPPYTWKASGTLPPGLTFGSDGTLSGTPTQVGTYAFSVIATDSAQQPMSSAPLAVVLHVNPFVTLSVSPQSVLAGQTATLSWWSLGATTCSASGAWAGTQALSGQANTSPVFPGQYFHALSCADSSGNTTVVTTNTITALIVGWNGYSSTQLVANNSGIARSSDPALINPWGIAFPANHAAVVANNQSNTSTSYDGTGVAQSPGSGTNPLAVQLPAGAGGAPFNPTAVVVAPAGMMVTAAGKSGPAQLIYAGESGMIAAWAPTVDPANAIVVYADKSGAVYKSLAVAGNHLYAADFHNNKIDVFDLTLTKQSGFPFIDPALPAGYAPHGLYVLLDYGTIRVYVAYAMQLAPANHDAAAGAGLGIVDVFQPDGSFSQRLASGGTLNAPGAMAVPPVTAFAIFGTFTNALLVANTGDGTINGFDWYTGASVGALSDASGTPLRVAGLHSIAMGNHYANQPDFTLFYTAGANNAGLFGRIDFGAAPRFHAPPNLSVTMSGSQVNNTYDVTVDATSTVGIAWLDLHEVPPSLGDFFDRNVRGPPFQDQFWCYGVNNSRPLCTGVSATVTDVDGNIATANATPP